MRQRPTGERRPPQIKDVAALAGVGVGTVSSVLNGTRPVTPPTRKRVQAAITEVGYKPSALARNLSRGKTETIGVVAPFFTTPSVVERLRGVVENVTESGYELLIFDVEDPGQRAAAFEGFVRSDRVDGVIIVSLPIDDRDVGLLRAQGVEAVLVDRTHPLVNSVAIDDIYGGRLAAEHLLELGHERVAFIGDEPNPSFGFDSARLRLEGFRAALRDADLWDAARPYVLTGPYGADVACAIAHQLLGLDRAPTAIFAASDVQALGVLRAARQNGLKVPEHLSVVGFDDIEIAGLVGLTTIRQPLRTSGQHASMLLLDALAASAPRPPDRLVLDIELVRRETTAPPI